MGPRPPGSFLDSTWLQIAGLVAIAAPLFLFKLGIGALLNWDEAIHAEVSKEIVTGHHWLTLYWQHVYYFRKPPLSYWIRAVAFRCFGVSAFWARFPSALAGIAVVLLTYAIGKRLAGAAAGVFAAFVLMTTNQFDRVMRWGTTDALLCFCIYLALYAWTRVEKDEAWWFYLLCAAVGTGAMIKGPAVLVAPMAIGVDWIIHRRSGKVVTARQFWIGCAVALAIVAPWHIWMCVKYGSAFISQYFGYQLAERATRVIEGSGGGPTYYLHDIFYGALPWSIVGLVAACKWIWRKEWSYSLTWALMGIVIGGYSIIPTKHPWYILPVFPALAIEVGRLLAEAGRRWRMVLYASAVVLAAGLIVAFTTLARRQGDPVTNQVAQMATVAGKSGETGPLYVVKGRAAEPELEVPTTVFYSGRPVVLLSMPADAKELAGLMQCRDSLDALVEEDAVGYLSRKYRVRRIAGNGAAAYVEVSERD